MKFDISSKFKYTVDIGVEATRTAYKLKKTKKELIFNIALVVGIFAMMGLMIWDILRDASYTFDLIVLIGLVVVGIMTIVMPIIIAHNQRKFLIQLKLEEMDYTITEIKRDKCLESYYKDGKIVMQNVCSISKLIAYQQKGNYIFVVFNNFACAVFDINSLSVDINDFIVALNQIILDNKQNKKS